MNSTSPQLPPRQTPSNWQLLRRLIALGLEYRGLALATLIFELALVALSIGSLAMVGVGIDFIRSQGDPSVPQPAFPLGWQVPEGTPPFQVVVIVSVVILVLAILGGLLKFASSFVSAALSQAVLVRIRTDVYSKLQKLNFQFYDSGESSSIINRAAGDANAVRNFVDGVMVRIFSVTLTLGVFLYYMLSVSVPLTIACLATTPLLWVGAVLFSRMVQPAYRQVSQLGDQLIRVLVESVQGVHVVKGFAREPQQIELFRQGTQRIQDQKQQIFQTVSVFQPVMGFITQINMVVLLGYGGVMVIRGELALGTGLFVFAKLLQEFANQIGQIVNIANSIQSSLVSAERVFEVIDAPVLIQSKPGAIQLDRAVGKIEFEDVSFGYRPDLPVLTNLNFVVNPGERVGITGETGAGKSTILALLMRFYDVSSGRILIDGHDIRDLDVDSLRYQIGLVFQESFLFSHTVAANIAFGRPDASLEEIRHAARLASASDFIAELPELEETLIGEHGANLSGGQRQRISLSRALLLDPPILLLDDATAAIDPETEHEIEQAIQKAMSGRSTLVVSNRIGTLRRADRILILQQGKITDSGNHEELLQSSEYYRQLAELQFTDGFTPLPERKLKSSGKRDSVLMEKAS